MSKKITVLDAGPLRRVSKQSADRFVACGWYQFSPDGREIHRLPERQPFTAPTAIASYHACPLPPSELPGVYFEEPHAKVGTHARI